MAPLKFKIASPCTQSWASMIGDAQRRHCGACQKNVYNFKNMTRTEIEVLLLKNEGRVCARLYQREDGTVLTNDCPVGLAAVRRRLVAGLMMAAALAFAAVAVVRRGGELDVGSLGRDIKARAIALERDLRSRFFVGAVIEKVDPKPKVLKGLVGPRDADGSGEE